MVRRKNKFNALILLVDRFEQRTEELKRLLTQEEAKNLIAACYGEVDLAVVTNCRKYIQF